MTVGAELAQARERLGLSREEISSRTKISVERLTAIELEDVAALPPLVYLKGFVREFAAAVNLDPEDTTRRYVAALDDVAGLMSATVPDLPFAPADAELSPLVMPHIEQPRSPAVTRSLLGIDDVPPLEPLTMDEFPTEQPAVDGQPRVAGQPRMGRMAIVAVVALLIGFLVSSNTSFLKSWWARTRGAGPARADVSRADAPPRAAATAPSASSPIDAAPAAQPATPRAAADDIARAAAAPAAPIAPDAPGARTAPVAPAAPAPVAPVARTAPDAPVPPVAPAAPTPAAPDAPVARTAPDAPVAPVAPVLSGSWSLTTRIEATDYAAFNNMNLGYRIQLQQQGDRITGRGFKWMENGKAIPARGRTPIEIEGIRSGDRLELRFTERGTRRTSSGTFVMEVAADGSLRGQFASTSANSSGSSVARRVSPDTR
jgi:cytoskeletal protein RodZ